MKKSLLLYIVTLILVSINASAFSISCDYPCYIEESQILAILRPPPRPLGLTTDADLANVKAICDAVNGRLLQPKCPAPPPGAR